MKFDAIKFEALKSVFLPRGFLYAKLRYLPVLMLSLAILSLMMSVYFAWLSWQATQDNQALRSQRLLKQTVPAQQAQKAYNKAYLLAQTGQAQQALDMFHMAEADGEDAIRARAKFAIANQYFDMAMHSANIAAGGAHQQAVAHIELAREAYKGALRIKPDMEAARFNLELLDRLSPEKRTQGWQAETDGVTLKPFKRNGTAMMRDNKRRGLP